MFSGTHFLYVFNSVGLIGVSFLIYKKITPYESKIWLRNIAYNVVYTALHNFFKVQIYLERITEKICKNESFLWKERDTILYIKDGKEIYSETVALDSSEKRDYSRPIKKNADFLIYTNTLSVILFDLDIIATPIAVPTAYKFVVLQITLENSDELYYLTLHSEKESFYAVNNVINKYVVQYLLYKQHKKYIDINDKYILNIIDNNVNTILLNETDELLFLKYDYEIFRGENNKKNPLFQDDVKLSDSIVFTQQVQVIQEQKEEQVQEQKEEQVQVQQVEQVQVIQVQQVEQVQVIQEQKEEQVQEIQVIQEQKEEQVVQVNKKSFFSKWFSFAKKK